MDSRKVNITLPISVDVPDGTKADTDRLLKEICLNLPGMTKYERFSDGSVRVFFEDGTDMSMSLGPTEEDRGLYLGEGLECVVTTEQEAEAICWQYCKNNDWDKSDCFHDGCPLAQIEIQRCQELSRQIDYALAVKRHNDCVMAAAVISACT